MAKVNPHAWCRLEEASLRLSDAEARGDDAVTAALDDESGALSAGGVAATADLAHPRRSARPYFELLLVAIMAEAQERALASGMRSWRRPDDAFVYELVVVGSGDEAVVAARPNPNLQACVITRRFSHLPRRDLSASAHFIEAQVSEDLADHSPNERVGGLRPVGRRQSPPVRRARATQNDDEALSASGFTSSSGPDILFQLLLG